MGGGAYRDIGGNSFGLSVELDFIQRIRGSFPVVTVDPDKMNGPDPVYSSPSR